jgi:ATP-binding cassette subfamily B (MDR/TAP) protein 1
MAFSVAGTSASEGAPADTDDYLRIVCLLPAATDICCALGLADSIVGVTHECRDDTAAASAPTPTPLLLSRAVVVTANGLGDDSALSQGEIHQRVQEQQQQQESKTTATQIPSLYPILVDRLIACRPTLIITQDLCAVCAPSTETVRKAFDDSSTTSFRLLSLTAQSLTQVGESFVTVADACGVHDRGVKLRNDLLNNFQSLGDVIRLHTNQTNHKPDATAATPIPRRVCILEWLDPPFDAGHWLPDLIRAVHAEPVTSDTTKSRQTSWADLEKADPDIVVLACCGFHLERTKRDANLHRHHLATLRACREGRIFAADGQNYFVKPATNLWAAAVILALCIYEDCPELVEAVRGLAAAPKQNVLDKAYQRLDWSTSSSEASTLTDIPDMEDFYALHQQACNQGERTYIDPATGYAVFTRVAHEQRGACCGSGCRHCPYHHENLRDRTRIQQPAVLYRGSQNDDTPFRLSNGSVHVLFWSGGKDSFLALRALARRQVSAPASGNSSQTPAKFGVVLLTTFDFTSRVIAHQDVGIDIVLKQAQHLDVTLVGVPLHRHSTEGYVKRLEDALSVVESLTDGEGIAALVFGDLHLQHIIDWREDQLAKLGYPLVYPLLHVPYTQLWSDLLASSVPCVVTASTVPAAVKVGDRFDQDFMDRLPEEVDRFGEQGEFHSVAQVWECEPRQALFGRTKLKEQDQ